MSLPAYFSYAAAFTDRGGEGADGMLVAIALTIAPFVFVVLAVVSEHPAPGRVLRALGLFVLVGLSMGLLAPILGAAAGFGYGGVLALRAPDHDHALRTRLVAVTLAVVYVFALLVFVTPAGVFTGAFLPLLALGFADEYLRWRLANPSR